MYDPHAYESVEPAYATHSSESAERLVASTSRVTLDHRAVGRRTTHKGMSPSTVVGSRRAGGTGKAESSRVEEGQARRRESAGREGRR